MVVVSVRLLPPTLNFTILSHRLQPFSPSLSSFVFALVQIHYCRSATSREWGCFILIMAFIFNSDQSQIHTGDDAPQLLKRQRELSRALDDFENQIAGRTDLDTTVAKG